MSIHHHALIAAFLLITGVAPAATVATTTAHKPAASTAKAKPAGMSDTELEKAIRARFATSKISSHHFQVHVQGGVATLQGQTDVLQHKGTATRLAKSMGAAQVVNKIEVSEAAREKAADNLSGGRRRAQVKRGDDRSDKHSE